MNIVPIIVNKDNSYKKCSFGHGHSGDMDKCSLKEKAIVAATSSAGIAISLACLAKKAGYSLNPSKMFKNIKNSYIFKGDFLAKEIVAIGAGTCLGGLAGGYLIDKNPINRNAKKREAIMQMGNISIPICTVALFNKICSKGGKIAQAVGSVAGIFTGVYLANYLMNKLGNVLFHNKNERGVKLIDFSAHVDDMITGAKYVAPNSSLIHTIQRIIPAILVFPGMEVGTRRAPHKQ